MKPLWLICLAAFLLRAAWALTRPADLSALPDQTEYLSIARNLLAGQGLMFVDPRYQTPTYAFRAPGYPLFMAACAALPPAIRLAQAALDASLILAVYLLVPKAAGRFALTAALLVALNPYLIFFSSLLLTETLFTALIVWATVLLLHTRDPLTSRSTATFLAGLLLLAFSVLVRPGAIALPVSLAVAAAMARPRLPAVPAGLTAAALTALVLLPWAYRNHVVLNEWIFTTTNAGVTAYDGFNPAADGSSNQAAFLPHYPELSQLTETQRNDYLLQLAAAYRAENPDRLLPLTVAKITRTWSPIPLADANRSTLTTVVGFAYYALLSPLALVGFFKFRGSPGLKFLLLVPALYLTITAAASVGSLRYRIPADPFIAVLAALGTAVIFTRQSPTPPTPAPTPPAA